VLLALIALHGVLAAAAPRLARRIGVGVFWACALAPLATLVTVSAIAGPALDGGAVVERFPWAPDLGLSFDLRLDGFGLLMVWLVAGVGVLVFAYAYKYFGTLRPDLGRFAGMLTAFAGAMLGLVLADNTLVLFLFWELTSVTSYLLIGFEDRKAVARAAALQALLITGVGGLAMLGGLVLLGQAAGTYSLSGLIAAAPQGPLVDAGLVLVLLGAFTKSAQAPFHSWLPGAMAAPTPVSAYLHSATMVKAGVYLIARLAPVFALAPPWRPLVLTVGAVTMLLGGWRALRQHDLKLVLAYGTVSQLGFLVVLFGSGYAEATLAGAGLLLAHGVFKAALFMVVGIVDRQAGTRDLRRLSGLHRPLRLTAVVAVVAAGSMAGLPPLLGFVAKEYAFEALLHADPGPAAFVVLASVVAGSALTVAYTARFVWGAFADKQPADLDAEPSTGTAKRPPVGFVAPAAVLAVLTLVLGLVPALASTLVVGAAQSLDAMVPDTRLSLWHGFNAALGLSLLAVATGALMWVARRRIERLQERVRGVPDAGTAYQRVVATTLLVADRVTGTMQPGSLPIYLGVILVTVGVVPAVALVLGPAPLGDLVAVDRAAQVTVAAVIGVGAVACTVSHRRFAAVLSLGAVGYGVAVLFVLQGAPDLALTQLLVETLVLALFVLVLRHLPEGFRSRRWALGQAPRVLIAALVGVFVASFTVLAVSARTAAPVAQAHLERSLPEAEGRNVVNVILADFRGFDTFGEIVVLMVCALGVIGLVRAARRDRRRSTGQQHQQPVRFRRSLILDTGVRTLFRVILAFSLYLLVAGHNAPGGGFIGGLVAGAALLLIYVSRGAERLRDLAPLTPEKLMGTGVMLAALTGMAGWLTGGQFLEHLHASVDLPVLGTVKASTTLVFDAGVYLLVVGLVLALLRSLGREEVVAP
jgi:multicomponent Na+:H+ antiporter subunit A